MFCIKSHNDFVCIQLNQYRIKTQTVVINAVNLRILYQLDVFFKILFTR